MTCLHYLPGAKISNTTKPFLPTPCNKPGPKGGSASDLKRLSVNVTVAATTQPVTLRGGLMLYELAFWGSCFIQ